MHVDDVDLQHRVIWQTRAKSENIASSSILAVERGKMLEVHLCLKVVCRHGLLHLNNELFPLFDDGSENYRVGSESQSEPYTSVTKVVNERVSGFW